MEMIMTSELADRLMADLASVAICALGGLIVNEDGSFDLEQMEAANAYAKKTFYAILEPWERVNKTEWQIEVGD